MNHTCSGCGFLLIEHENWPPGQFRKRRYRCRSCIAKQRAALVAKDPQKHRESHRQKCAEWRAANIDHYRAYQREYHRQYKAKKKGDQPDV